GLAEFGAVSGLTFSEVGSSDAANLSVARTTQLGAGHPSGFTGYGYYPGSNPWSGDVWFSSSTADVGDSQVLSRGTYRLVLHELGHAMGLKHSQDVGGP